MSSTSEAELEKERDKERSKVLGELIWKQNDRLHNLQSLAFQLGNYYFVFQGVILSAVSNTSSITCSDSWFLLILSLLATIVNTIAVGSIGWKYVNVDIQYRKTWMEYNKINAKINDSQVEDELSKETLGKEEDGNNNNDKLSKLRRYIVLVCYMLFLLGFSGVTLYGSSGLLCAHDKHRSKGYDLSKSDYCFKLCNNSRECMFLCAQTAI